MVSTNQGVQYAYDPRNKRVWQGPTAVDSNGNLSTQQLNFYGVDGKKLGSYTVYVQTPSNQAAYLSDAPGQVNTYFGGKLLGPYDRLGSQRTASGGYYPYGEDKGTPLPNDGVKFATYTRDGATGLDYADQRYYSSQLGRFVSPDPYKASSGLSNPGSWNRYAYVEGDPANAFDPLGLFSCPPGSYNTCVDVTGGATIGPIYSFGGNAGITAPHYNPQTRARM